MDLYACVAETQYLEPGHSMLISTGIKIALPEGYEAQVRPRSGLALKKQVTVLNTPGTIDSDYRGEIKVIMGNLGREPVLLQHGSRIAQMVLARVQRAEFIVQEKLTSTLRGSNGLGSTGIS